MSLLPATSHANPSTPFWSTSGGGGGGGATATGTNNGGVVVPIVDAFTEYTPVTYSTSGVGTYVITAIFKNLTLSPSAGSFYGAVSDSLSGLSAGCQQVETTGNFGSMSCVLTIPNVAGINANVVLQSSLAGSQMTVQWSILYFPS
jgi:hypothetical protein